MDNIISKVAEIAYNIKSNTLLKKTEGLDIPLTGAQLQFDALDMCYLALEISSYYQIWFNADDLYDQRFNNIRSIAEIIFRKIYL